jgi:hypothetical protein
MEKNQNMNDLYEPIDFADTQKLQLKIKQFEQEVIDKRLQLSTLQMVDRNQCTSPSSNSSGTNGSIHDYENLKISLALAEHVLDRLQRLLLLEQELNDFYEARPQSQKGAISIVSEMKYMYDELNIYFSDV